MKGLLHMRQIGSVYGFILPICIIKSLQLSESDVLNYKINEDSLIISKKTIDNTNNNVLHLKKIGNSYGFILPVIIQKTLNLSKGYYIYYVEDLIFKLSTLR